MPEPTLVGASASEANGTGATETTGSLSWLSGDRLLVLGMTEDNGVTLSTPGGLTNLTLSALTGSPTTAASSCKGYAWGGTATGSGSGTIATTITGATKAFIVAFLYRDSDGFGTPVVSAALGAATTQSVTRVQANSAVAQIWGDWEAVNDIAVTWTPTGQTQMLALNIGGGLQGYSAHWPDQGATGTTAYGFTAHAGGADMTAITVEVKGTAGGAAPTWLPRRGSFGQDANLRRFMLERRQREAFIARAARDSRKAA